MCLAYPVVRINVSDFSVQEPGLNSAPATADQRIYMDLMTVDRKLDTSREGSK